jgi:plasmid replication initiation protein
MALFGAGQYKEVRHIRAAILDRAKEELDRVADVSFSYDPVHEGKRIIGWDFVPVSNKPKERALPGKRRAKKRDEKETAENGRRFLKSRYWRAQRQGKAGHQRSKMRSSAFCSFATCSELRT